MTAVLNPPADKLILEGITHGRSGRRKGCQCDDCYEGERSYQRDRHRAKAPAQDRMKDAVQFAEVPGPGAWKSRGACVGLDPNLFFPEVGESAAEAKKACTGCPVFEQCFEYSMTLPVNMPGTFAGMTWKERRAAKRAMIAADKAA